MRISMRLLVVVAAVWVRSACGPANAQEPPRTRLQINFEPSGEQFVPAAREYAELWASEGARIVAAMERATGLRFEGGPIAPNILEATSYSGYGERPMQLRASYPAATKR